MSERFHPVADSFAAMQVQGPGEVNVLGPVVTFFSDDNKGPVSFILARYDTMGKLAGIIDSTPTRQAHLLGALQDDPSNTLKDMPRTRCDVPCGVTLYTKGLLI